MPPPPPRPGNPGGPPPWAGGPGGPGGPPGPWGPHIPPGPEKDDKPPRPRPRDDSEEFEEVDEFSPVIQEPGPVINTGTGGSIPQGPGPVINTGTGTGIPQGPGPIINTGEGVTVPQEPGPETSIKPGGMHCICWGQNEVSAPQGDDPEPVVGDENDLEGGSEPVIIQEEDMERKDSLDDEITESEKAIKRITERLKQLSSQNSSINRVVSIKEAEQLQEVKKEEKIIEEIVEENTDNAYWDLETDYIEPDEGENLVEETPEEIDYLEEIERKLQDIQSRLKKGSNKTESVVTGSISEANISEANISEANISEANIPETNISETNISESKVQDKASEIHEVEDGRKNRGIKESTLAEIYAKGEMVESFIQETVDTEWVKIPYGEFLKIPGLSYEWCSQPFITFAYYKYNEILLGHNGEGKYYLGIPDIYNPNRQSILSDPIEVTGFLCRQNMQPVNGEYGYWIIPLSEEEH